MSKPFAAASLLRKLVHGFLDLSAEFDSVHGVIVQGGLIIPLLPIRRPALAAVAAKAEATRQLEDIKYSWPA